MESPWRPRFNKSINEPPFASSSNEPKKIQVRRRQTTMPSATKGPLPKEKAKERRGRQRKEGTKRSQGSVWQEPPFFETLLGNLFLGTLLATFVRNRNLPFKTFLGTRAENLFVGTCSWNLAWEPVLGDLWEPVPESCLALLGNLFLGPVLQGGIGSEPCLTMNLWGIVSQNLVWKRFLQLLVEKNL